MKRYILRQLQFKGNSQLLQKVVMKGIRDNKIVFHFIAKLQR
jgi:hypothetical protein